LACATVIAAEPVITRYDQILGDGDCGQTLKAGAEGAIQSVHSLR
jgi:dihydroxyacetone kinase